MLKEFKEFALKGNIVDLAVGVIIGGAFQGIVNSLVNDIIMPFITIFTGKVDFSELTVTIGQSSIKYGSFITAIVNFLIIAFSIFLFIKYINGLNKKMEKVKEKENSKLQKIKEKQQEKIEALKNKTKLSKNITKKIEKLTQKQEKIKNEEPTTKTCPYCCSEISIKAVRCPHCTSELE